MMALNDNIIRSMQSYQIPEVALNKYLLETEQIKNNTEALGAYWANKVIALDTHTQNYVDLTINLRIVEPEILWLRTFEQFVIPLILHRNLLG